MQQKLTPLVFVVLLMSLVACGHQPSPVPQQAEEVPGLEELELDEAQPYQQEGFGFLYPEDWSLLAEEQVEGSVTARFHKEENSVAQMIISYFPVPDSTEEEALHYAEELLRSSLVRIETDLFIREEIVGDREIPIISAQSGATEVKLAEMAVIIGDKGMVFATLVVREEFKEEFFPTFLGMLQSIQVD